MIHATYINLARRPDRREAFLARFPANCFAALTRCEAIDGMALRKPPGFAGSDGGYACCESHRSVIMSALQAGIRRIAIFEDDCLFSPDFAERLPALLANPVDILYFGGIEKKTRYNEWQEPGIGGSWAYVVNREAMLRVLREPVKYDWDRVMSRCFSDLRVYIASPRVCGHAAGVADNEPGRVFTSEIW